MLAHNNLFSRGFLYRRDAIARGARNVISILRNQVFVRNIVGSTIVVIIIAVNHLKGLLGEGNTLDKETCFWHFSHFILSCWDSTPHRYNKMSMSVCCLCRTLHSLYIGVFFCKCWARLILSYIISNWTFPLRRISRFSISSFRWIDNDQFIT